MAKRRYMTMMEINSKVNPIIENVISLQEAIQNLDINKADNIHSHAWSSITNRPTIFSGSYNDLTDKPVLPLAATRYSLGFVSPATKITDSVINAPVNAATNAPTDSKTDYSLLGTILSGLVDGLNTTNTKQNQIGTIVNANAVKQNAGFAILNTLAGKFNLSLDILENNGLMSA